MKNNKTSERNILEKIENVSIVNGLDQEKFSFQMTEQEKKERLAFYNSQFEKVTKKAVEEDFDVLFLDETIYTISAGLLDEKLVLDCLKETGQAGSDPDRKYTKRGDDRCGRLCIADQKDQASV